LTRDAIAVNGELIFAFAVLRALDRNKSFIAVPLARKGFS
jgi:hypothetical protein